MGAPFVLGIGLQGFEALLEVRRVRGIPRFGKPRNVGHPRSVCAQDDIVVNFREGGMSAKAVTKKKAKRASKKGSTKKTAKNAVNVAEVRDHVLHLIADQAELMTKANVEEASKGHLAHLKYFFEVLGVHPVSATEQQEAEDSNDLARVLLNRFDFPYKGPADEEQEETSKDEAAKELVPAGAPEDSVD